MTQFTVTHHGTSTYQYHRVTTVLDDSVHSDPPRYQHLPTAHSNSPTKWRWHIHMDICLQRQIYVYLYIHTKCKLFIWKVFLISLLLYNLSSFNRKQYFWLQIRTPLTECAVIVFLCWRPPWEVHAEAHCEVTDDCVRLVVQLLDCGLLHGVWRTGRRKTAILPRTL